LKRRRKRRRKRDRVVNDWSCDEIFFYRRRREIFIKKSRIFIMETQIISKVMKKNGIFI
jgi:hypothetical protein